MPCYRLQQHCPFVADSVFLAPNASLIGDVTIATGASVWFGAVLRGDTAPVRIGSGTNVQDLCVLHADPGFPLTIGEGVTIGHRAIVHGCTVHNHCLIGMGAVIMNGAVLEEGVIVAAGAVVLEGTRVPAGHLVAGTPARVIKALDPNATDALQTSATGYRKKAELYFDPQHFERLD